MESLGIILMIVWLAGWPISAIGLLVRNIRLKKRIEELLLEQEKQQQEMQTTLALKQKVVDQHKRLAAEMEMEVNRLSPYRAIADVDAAIAERKAALLAKRDAVAAQLKAQQQQAQDKLRQEQERLEKERRDAQNELKERQREAQEKILHEYNRIAEERAAVQEERKQIIAAAREERERLVADAQQEAKKLAEHIQRLNERETQLQKAVTAIRNTIGGYDDSYLVPASSLLDELADQYDFKEAGQKLKAARDATRNMIKAGTAATCEYVEPERRKNAVRFVLDAFNGKVDSVLAKVKHDNYGMLRQQIEDAYSIVNANGSAFRDARIFPEFLVARLEELKWAVAARELQRRDREEQKRIQQQIREEERARREYEKAMKEAAKEERLLAEAIAKVQAEMQAASAEQRAKYEAKLKDMEAKLKEAEEKNQKALSMAQQTKSGHVYIISNIGSFGDDVFKIGMTRRLEPLDRVRELSDASVPFAFDVHAMIYSTDAPALEHALHLFFCDNQVNRVNPRKEFFRVGLADIRAKIEEMGLETQWTMRAEAAEYRESLAMLERGQGAATPVEEDEDIEMEAEFEAA